jgi:hypothetical protein
VISRVMVDGSVRARSRMARSTGQVTVIDEASDTLRAERVTILVGVDGKIWQGITPDRMQNAAGILRDDLDVAVEQDPVAWLWLVMVAQRVPAMMRLRILEDRGHTERARVRVDPDIGPFVERPRVGRPSGDPALLANDVRAKFQGHAGECRARSTVINAIHAGLLPDDRLHLGRRSCLGHVQVVIGDIDNR